MDLFALPEESYESRYRFTVVSLVASPLLLCYAGFVLYAAVLAVRDPPTNTGEVWAAAGAVTFFVVGAALLAWMGLSWLIAAATHRVALRVDANGVTLGRVPFPPSRRVTVPFRDIEAVVLFRRHGNGRWLTLVGLRLRPGVPRGSTMRRLLYRVNTGLLHPYPVDVYRAVYGWTLDETALRAALAGYQIPVRHEP
jgi:hypothetical protein